LHRWHVLFTKSRCERKVADVLDVRDIETYVPLMWHHGKRGNLLGLPFFPRYMFARLDWENTRMAGVQWTPGLTRVVTFDGQPAWLPDDKIDYLRRRLGDLDGDDFLRLKQGEAVRVTRGPFAELEAVFDAHLNGDKRVAVLLKILGRQTRVILGGEDVERLG
jgi:transcriptional antiterminator RfaH